MVAGPYVCSSGPVNEALSGGRNTMRVDDVADRTEPGRGDRLGLLKIWVIGLANRYVPPELCRTSQQRALVAGFDNVIVLSPPLIITDDDLAFISKVLEEVVGRL